MMWCLQYDLVSDAAYRKYFYTVSETIKEEVLTHAQRQFLPFPPRQTSYYFGCFRRRECKPGVALVRSRPEVGDWK